MAGNLGPHEILNFHEHLLSEVTSAHELTKQIGQIQDNELKNIAQTCLDLKRRHVTEMSQILRQNGLS